mgnify:CR=1 FL=1
MSMQKIRSTSNEKLGILEIESQTPKGIIGISAHVNEKVLALQTSKAANIMFKRNKPLFTKINKTTRLVSGKLYRLEYKSFRQHRNKNGAVVFRGQRPSKYLISLLNFKEGTLQHQQRRLFGASKTTELDPQKKREASKKEVLDIASKE